MIKCDHRLEAGPTLHSRGFRAAPASVTRGQKVGGWCRKFPVPAGEGEERSGLFAGPSRLGRVRVGLTGKRASPLIRHDSIQRPSPHFYRRRHGCGGRHTKSAVDMSSDDGRSILDKVACHVGCTFPVPQTLVLRPALHLQWDHRANDLQLLVQSIEHVRCRQGCCEIPFQLGEKIGSVLLVPKQLIEQRP